MDSYQLMTGMCMNHSSLAISCTVLECIQDIYTYFLFSSPFPPTHFLMYSLSSMFIDEQLKTLTKRQNHNWVVRNVHVHIHMYMDDNTCPLLFYPQTHTPSFPPPLFQVPNLCLINSG